MFRMNGFQPRSWVAALTGAGLAAAGVSVAAVTAVPAAASTAITITSGGCSGGGSLFCYSPEPATATVGTPVTWTNQSGVAHTVTVCTSSSCAGAPANTGSDTFNVSIAAGNGSTGSFTFMHAGTYIYYCAIHGYAGMHGRITVTAASTATSAPAAPTPTPSSAAAATPSTSTPATGASPASWGVPIAAAGLLALLLAIGVRRRRH